MSFTDTQLASSMRDLLVNTNVMTSEQQEALLEDPTENNVRETLRKDQLDNFGSYWTALGTWLSGVGGDISQTKGTIVPGREGGNPTKIAIKALYNDAFWDVTQHIGRPGFLPVKAVANQLRFVSYFLEDN